MSRRVVVGLNAVIVAVTDQVPKVLTIRRGEREELPYGPLDADRHPTLERGLRDWVLEQTGLELGYVEQLYTFGDRDRDPTSSDRLLSVVYLALVREREVSAKSADWRPVYDHLPWEDGRDGVAPLLAQEVIPALRGWLERGSRSNSREQRLEVGFGLGDSPWDGERVLKRYELLYEAGLLAESQRERRARQGLLGRPMGLDHRRMLATALGRLRGKIRYRPVIFELLPDRFTLFELQRTAEALAGKRLHKQNFRRLVMRGGLVEGTGATRHDTGGRPAEMFRFRSAVVREWSAQGVGLPGLPRAD